MDFAGHMMSSKRNITAWTCVISTWTT